MGCCFILGKRNGGRQTVRSSSGNRRLSVNIEQMTRSIQRQSLPGVYRQRLCRRLSAFFDRLRSFFFIWFDDVHTTKRWRKAWRSAGKELEKNYSRKEPKKKTNCVAWSLTSSSSLLISIGVVIRARLFSLAFETLNGDGENTSSSEICSTLTMAEAAAFLARG